MNNHCPCRCFEQDNNGRALGETEQYKCTSTTSSYCLDWSGFVDGVEEFEFSSATCTTPVGQPPICSSWRAFERGVDYHYPRLTWVLLPILLGGAIGGFPLMACYSTDSARLPSAVLVPSILIVPLGLTFVATWKAGVVALLLSVGVLLGLLLVADLIALAACGRKRSLLGRLVACYARFKSHTNAERPQSRTRESEPARPVEMETRRQQNATSGAISVNTCTSETASSYESDADKSSDGMPPPYSVAVASQAKARG